ncbi:MAG: hypothetical protein FJ303_06985 [Planctomycetes bacterium]|nr:hypothetical protein [Planctomycetota bacterium]
MAAFRRLLPTLLGPYRGKYAAIHEERVVGSGDDLLSFALAAYKESGYQPIFVDRVTDEPPPPARIPHFNPV